MKVCTACAEHRIIFGIDWDFRNINEITKVFAAFTVY